LPVADPADDAELADVANELTSPEKVYLVLVVTLADPSHPIANIPTVP
jgi:hypothetical protein